jgi:hypothetical protein
MLRAAAAPGGQAAGGTALFDGKDGDDFRVCGGVGDTNVSTGSPMEEREVFDLLWYHALTQAEAAELLQVTDRTVKRRWRSARLRLHRALRRESPEGHC